MSRTNYKIFTFLQENIRDSNPKLGLKRTNAQFSFPNEWTKMANTWSNQCEGLPRRFLLMVRSGVSSGVLWWISLYPFLYLLTWGPQSSEGWVSLCSLWNFVTILIISLITTVYRYIFASVLFSLLLHSLIAGEFKPGRIPMS